MSKIVRALAVVIFTAMITACSSNSPKFDDSAPDTGKSQQCIHRESLKGILAEGVEKVLEKIDKELDEVLACLVGPDDFKDLDDEKKKEIKLLRGHIIATIIARYAAYKSDGQIGGLTVPFDKYEDLSEDTGSMLINLGRVEQDLRGRSSLFNLDRSASGHSNYSSLPLVQKELERVQRLLTVTLMAEALGKATRPARYRGRSAVLKLTRAVVTSSKKGVSDSLGDLKPIMGNFVFLKSFQSAYRKDARNYLNCVVVREQDGKVPSLGTCKTEHLREDWQYWDQLLLQACDRLADIAVATNVCIPVNKPNS